MTPFDDVLMTTMRTWVVRSGRFKQGVSLSIDLPKKLIGKVLLEINREMGQGLFEGTKVSFFHVALHRRTVYTVIYTVLLWRTNSGSKHSLKYTV